MFLIRPSIVAAAILGICLLFLNSELVTAQVCSSNLYCLEGTFCNFDFVAPTVGACEECPPSGSACSEIGLPDPGIDACQDVCKDIDKANTHECDDFMVGSQAKKECLENYYNFKNLCNLSTCEKINDDNDLPSMWRCDDEEHYSLNDDEYDYLWEEVGYMQEENTCNVMKRVCNSNLDCSGGTFCDYNSIFSQDGTCEQCPPPTSTCFGSNPPNIWSIDSCVATCEDNDEAIDESNCALLFSGPGLDSTDGSALNECLKKKYNTADFCNFNCDELRDDTDVYNTAVYECEYEMVQNSFSWCNSPPRRYSHVGRTSNCLFDCPRLVDPDLHFACSSSTFKIGCDRDHNPTERDDCDWKIILSASHRNTFISCKDNWDTCSLLDEKTNGADGQSTTYRQDINACFDTESFSNIGEKGICDINCDLIFNGVFHGDVLRASCRNLWKQNWCDCHQLPSGSEAMKQCLENYYNIENLCNVSNCKGILDPDLQSWCYSFEETYLNNDEIDYLLREKGDLISNNLCKISRNSNEPSDGIVVGALVAVVIIFLFCASSYRRMHQPIPTVQNPAMAASQVAMPSQLPALSREDQIAKIAQMTTAELKILYSDAFDRNKHQVVLEASRVLVGKPQPKPPPLPPKKKKRKKKKKTKTQGDSGESKPKKKKRKKKKQPPPPLPKEAIDDDIYLALQTVRHSIFNAQNANDSDSEDSTSNSDDDSCIDPNVSKESTMVHPRASTEEADAQLAAELAKKQSSPPRTDNLVSGECVVCLESMKVGEMVVWSETQCCNHVFHKSCMVSFLAHQRHTPAMVREDANPCPMCRQKYLTVLSADNNV